MKLKIKESISCYIVQTMEQEPRTIAYFPKFLASLPAPEAKKFAVWFIKSWNKNQ